MYAEFIIIYVGMGILALLSIASIVLSAIILKKAGSGFSGKPGRYTDKSKSFEYASNQIGVVFCKNCGTQFDGTTRVCPKCGTPR